MGGKYKNCKIVLAYDDKCSECKNKCSDGRKDNF